MREEEDPGSPAILLNDLDQAWMVILFKLISSSSLSGEVLLINLLLLILVVSSRLSFFFVWSYIQKDCPEYREYTKAVIAMGDSIRLAECFNMTVRDAYELPKQRATLVMFRDFDES